MEVVDTGSRPADEFLDLLFEGQALRSLLQGHGAACFALVRPMTAPAFFRGLIENSATIDATTRKHVAFVVFYGDRSSVVREGDIGYGPYGPQRGKLRVRFVGLSVSGDPDAHSDVLVRPTMPPRLSEYRLGERQNVFSDNLGALFRRSPEEINHPLLSHHMSRVATRLMEIYDIRESALPCMLFTDGDDPKRHLVVRLDPREPLDSLYVHLLKPLSEQFGTLSGYWKRRDDLSSKRQMAKWSAGQITKLRTEIANVSAEIAHQRQVIPEQIRKHQKTLDDLQAERMRKLEALPLVVSERSKVARELQANLAVIGRGEREFRSPAHRTLEVAKLRKRLFKELQRLGAHESEVNLKAETGRMRLLRIKIKELADCVPNLELKRIKLEADLERENKQLKDYSGENLQREDVEIRRMAENLNDMGYGREVIDADRPSFSAIKVMLQNQLLGFRSPITSTSGDLPMRILFLAANPTSTTPLDLEEELRSLEGELRGVKYRDQIVLAARHAVRPDDLVRYVRSERPTVVHFSGHGSGNGIMLRNDEGGYTEVTGANLRRFFSNRGVRLVVLNACYTQEQAKLLSGAVSAVVGTTDSVGDVAARRFTVAFYRALGDGFEIREAFRDGGDAVILDNKADVFWSDGELDQLLVTPTNS